MPTFHGSMTEYHKYIGPRIRNAINVLCRPMCLKQNGICAHCKKKNGHLESAHKTGRERKKLIEKALQPYFDGTKIKCTLQKAEELIIQQHLPIQDNFIFLCNSCHRTYDSKKENKPTRTSSKPVIAQPISTNAKFHRIEKWANNPQQINSQIVKSYLDLCLANEGIPMQEFIDLLSQAGVCKGDAQKIKGNLNSMVSDNGNSHGLVFNKENGMYQMPDHIFKFANNAFTSA